MNRIDQATRIGRSNKPRIVCELVKHPEGDFVFGGRPYRPEWPIAPRGEDSLKEAREIVGKGIWMVNQIYSGRQGSPRRVRIEKYNNDRIIILVAE